MFSAAPAHADSHPDLVVVGVDVTDSSPETGEKFRLGMTVTNDGDGESAATSLKYKRSTDSTISTSDTTIGTESIRALVPPQGNFESIRLTAPSSPGTYYYGGCVDAVAGETNTSNNCSSSVKVTVSRPPPPPPPPSDDTSDSSETSGSSGTSRSSETSSPPESPAPAAPVSVIGMTTAATATELPNGRLLIQRHDVPDASFELAVGSISADGMTVVLAGVIRDATLGQTYLVVRRESDGRIVRRWVPPSSPLVYHIPWAVVNTQYTVPIGVIGAIPLDDQFPEPNLLVRRFDGGDDRIFGYDAAIGQWRHVPNIPTFQALGFYWCDVTAADADFFTRITPGPPYPASQTPAQDDYPDCLTS